MPGSETHGTPFPQPAASPSALPSPSPRDPDLGPPASPLADAVAAPVRPLPSLPPQGADPWAQDMHVGRRALHYAATENSAECIHALLSHSPARLLADAAEGSGKPTGR